jgi:PAS domain S-box-containing protein
LNKDDVVFERLRRTFDCAPVGVAYVEPSGVLLDVNPTFCSMLGYTREELRGRTFQQITHPDDVRTNVDLLEQLRAGQIEGYRMQKRYLRADGDNLWADLTVSVLKDEAGRPLSFISIITDIGEQKRLEDRLQFVLSELGHRSKNFLTVIRALAHRIAATAATAKDMLAALDDRLTGMAASQDLLVNADQGAAMADLVRRQVAAFVPLHEERVEIAGPSVELGPIATHTLGMALHELATNACKYGAMSAPEGRIRIEWTLDAAQGAFRLTWIERGGPTVARPTHRGFGHQVIERAAPASLDGEAVLSFLPEGVEWALRAPISALSR